MKQIKILFLGGGPAFLDSIPLKDKFIAFSQVYSGFFLTPSLNNENGVMQIGNFQLNYFPYISSNVVLRNISLFCNLLITGKKIYNESGFDLIISPNPLVSGFAGVFLSRATGSKLIVEVNGNFESAFKFSRLGSNKKNVIDVFKDNTSKILIKFVLQRCNMIKLVNSNQLTPLKIRKKVNSTVFPNFVPIRHFVNHKKEDKKFILLLGYPWFLKGVDILIKAFNIISKDFPEYSLKIVGWCPEDKRYYQRLAAGNKKIQLCDAVEYKEVIELMTGCSLYVLASRTDSSPRVLREAMASKKPIIAANIDGVPELIKDGYNGLLFEKESVDDLADKIRLLLSQQGLAETLSKNGYQYVQRKFSEDVYIKKYEEMITKVFADNE